MTRELQARSRRGWLRALFFGTAAFFGSLALAAPGRCDDVTEGERPLCLMVQACAMLADAGKRQECFAAAADRFTGSERDQPSQPIRVDHRQPDLPSQMRTAVESLEEPRITDSVPETVTRERSAGAEVVPDRTAGTLDEVRRLFSRSSAPVGGAIPRRFTAQVTAHRDLVRDRQLLVLDGELLFEGDNAASSAIQVGDEVSVVKASSLRGRRYQISGPSKRRFDALRIRCERTDLNADNRRKCDGMMGG